MTNLVDQELKRNLNFDLYGRYAVIRDIIQINRSSDRVLRILDVGGSGNLLHKFLPTDAVYYLDPRDNTHDSNYICANGCLSPFKDETFDWVASADVLEHIDPTQRAKFLQEKLRISKLGAILVAPFYSPEVRIAEENANESYKALFQGKDHVWLNEHRVYGLPDQLEIEQLLHQQGYPYQKFGNNYLPLWQIFQAIMYHASEHPSAEIQSALEEFNLFYNTHIYPVDATEPAYRKVYFIKKRPDLKEVVALSGIDTNLLLRTIKEGMKLIEQVTGVKNALINQLNETLTAGREELLFLKDQLQNDRKLASDREQHYQKTIEEFSSQLQIANDQQRESQHIINTQTTQLNLVATSKTWRILRLYDRTRMAILNYIQKIFILTPRLIVRGLVVLWTKGPIVCSREVRQYFRTSTQNASTVSSKTIREKCKEWEERKRPSQEDLRRSREAQAKFRYRPLISVIMPVYNTKIKWLEQAIRSVLEQTYDHWELHIIDDGSTRRTVKDVLIRFQKLERRIKVQFLHKNIGVAGASNIAATSSSGEFVTFLDHDDYLSPNAFYSIIQKLNENDQLDFIYSDEALVTDENELRDIYFRPEYSESFMLSHPYIVHLVAIRRTLLCDIGGFNEAMKVSQDYDLFLRALAVTKRTRVGHIAEVLYYWRQHQNSLGHLRQAEVMESSKAAIARFLELKNIEAEVLDGPVFNTFRVRYSVKNPPLVSIIIPTKDKVDLLDTCLGSLERKNSYKSYEVIVVSNGSQNEETLRYLAEIKRKHIVIEYNKDFHFSNMNNLATQLAHGELILFLNNDVEMIHPDSIAAMVELFQRDITGIVGAKLLYPDNRIQHAGVILGLMGFGDHIFKFMDNQLPGGIVDPGYLTSLLSIRDYSAVTAACMMIRASLFHEVGGFDENIKIGYGDTDLCLKVRELGYEVLFTPYALMYHRESSSRLEMQSETFMRHPEDTQYFVSKWKGILAAGDPFYNPNLSLNSYSCSPKT